jgi:hypothetical protein
MGGVSGMARLGKDGRFPTALGLRALGKRRSLGVKGRVRGGERKGAVREG